MIIDPIKAGTKNGNRELQTKQGTGNREVGELRTAATGNRGKRIGEREKEPANCRVRMEGV